MNYSFLIAKGLLILIVDGIPINRDNDRLSSITRLI